LERDPEYEHWRSTGRANSLRGHKEGKKTREVAPLQGVCCAFGKKKLDEKISSSLGTATILMENERVIRQR